MTHSHIIFFNCPQIVNQLSQCKKKGKIFHLCCHYHYLVACNSQLKDIMFNLSIGGLWDATAGLVREDLVNMLFARISAVDWNVGP